MPVLLVVQSAGRGAVDTRARGRAAQVGEGVPGAAFVGGAQGGPVLWRLLETTCYFGLLGGTVVSPGRPLLAGKREAPC